MPKKTVAIFPICLSILPLSLRVIHGVVAVELLRSTKVTSFLYNISTIIRLGARSHVAHWTIISWWQLTTTVSKQWHRPMKSRQWSLWSHRIKLIKSVFLNLQSLRRWPLFIFVFSYLNGIHIRHWMLNLASTKTSCGITLYLLLQGMLSLLQFLVNEVFLFNSLVNNWESLKQIRFPDRRLWVNS